MESICMYIISIINNIRLNKKIGAKALLMISVSIMDNKIIKEKETKA